MSSAPSLPWIFCFMSISSVGAQDLIQVPAGTYEVQDQVTTLPLRVHVSAFLIGASEITQEEYEKVVSENPSEYRGADKPVHGVTWWNAIRYCNRRSRNEGLPPCYDETTGQRSSGCAGYRLPTEAEWMRAAGTLAQDTIPAAAKLGSHSTKSTAIFRDALEAGPLPVRSLAPNEYGLYDLYGNVWEWCDDYFDVVISPDSIRNPRGPTSGLARVIRGGSFVSTTSGWSRGYRSSMSPDSASIFTGFRVVRAGGAPDSPSAVPANFFERFNDAPAAVANTIGSLASLIRPGVNQPAWEGLSRSLRDKWQTLLRPPATGDSPVKSRVLREVAQRNFSGTLLEVELELGLFEKAYVLRPRDAYQGSRPVVIVPFYDVDTPAATDLGGRNYSADRGVNAFAYTAAQHGYIAVAIRWFGESYGESYSEAVANLARRHPESTGMGKWISDARRLCDFIADIPQADASRIGIIGHSLGGKMALYAAAFEPRIAAVVSSELGIGFSMSNYDDYWYLGDRIHEAPKGTDQHELIGLVAPRPFLLIGGDEYDGNDSWHYINAAKEVYRVFGKPNHIGYLNHHSGHTPAPGAVAAAFEWLDFFLKP